MSSQLRDLGDRIDWWRPPSLSLSNRTGRLIHVCRVRPSAVLRDGERLDHRCLVQTHVRIAFPANDEFYTISTSERAKYVNEDTSITNRAQVALSLTNSAASKASFGTRRTCQVDRLSSSPRPAHVRLSIFLFSSLSTIVQQSEQILTPVKSSQINISLRRTSSLHLAHRQNLSDSILKASSSHHDELNTTQSTLIHTKETAANMSRRSLRRVEPFSGIKCSLPTGKCTVPSTFKGLEKHCTPGKSKQRNSSSTVLVCFRYSARRRSKRAIL